MRGTLWGAVLAVSSALPVLAQVSSAPPARPGVAAGLSLREAIAEAERSPQARAALDRVDVARGAVTQAGLRPNPRLYVQSEDLRPWDSSFDFPNQTEDYAYLGQLFELGGKRARRLDFARANQRLAETDRAVQERAIAARVAAAYWTAVAAEGIAHLLEQDLAAVEAIVGYNRQRVDAGALRAVDLLRSELERDRVAVTLATARREAALARLELARQIGRDPAEGGGSPAPAALTTPAGAALPASAGQPPMSSQALQQPRTLRLTDTLDAAPAIAPAPLAQVLAARPEIAAARQAVEAARADLRLQEAVARPDLDVTAGYKRNVGDNTLYTMLQIPLTLRNRNQGEIERARAGVRLAEDRLRALELSVGAELDAARQDFELQSDVANRLLPTMRARAKENLSILDDAYRSGGLDLLRYIDAERTEIEVETSALRTLAEFQQAGLRLRLAMGEQP